MKLVRFCICTWNVNVGDIKLFICPRAENKKTGKVITISLEEKNIVLKVQNDKSLKDVYFLHKRDIKGFYCYVTFNFYVYSFINKILRKNCIFED